MDNSLDIITVFNPDNEVFYIRYDNKSYGIIEPGKARRMPRFMAKLVIKHLVDQCINKENGNTADQALRDKWLSSIVIDEEIYAPVQEETEDDKIRRDLERLNQSSDLDRILANKKGESTQTPANFAPAAVPAPAPQPAPTPYHENPANQMQPTAPQVQQTPPPASLTPSAPVETTPPPPPSNAVADLGISAPTGEGKTLPEVDNIDTPVEAPAAPADSTEPTREQLYTYATKVLGMTLEDVKTKEALDIQTVPQLIETLGYDATAAI